MPSVEIRHSFTTDWPGQQILVHVHQHAHSVVSEGIDEFLDLIEISSVELTRSGLNGLPHDAEADHVDAPRLQVIDVLLSESQLDVSAVLSLWDERSLFVDDIDSMPNHMATMLVSESGV